MIEYAIWPISVLSDKYFEISKKCIHVKTVTAKPNDKPWFNLSIRKALRIRERLYKQLERTYSISPLSKYQTQRRKA